MLPDQNAASKVFSVHHETGISSDELMNPPVSTCNVAPTF